MESEISDIAPRIYVGLEGQEDATRGKRQIEAEWQKWAKQDPALPEHLRILNIDKHLRSLARRAITQGRNEMTVVDLGSGPKSTFVDSFSDVTQFSKLHEFLRHHSEFRLNVVGVTAATPGSIQPQLIRESEFYFKNGSKLVRRDYGYTITNSQSLGNFINQVLENLPPRKPNKQLSNEPVPKVDAFFSTWGLGYLTPANFSHAVDDLVEKMRPGGTFHCIMYDAIPAGFTRHQFGFSLHDEMVGKDHPFWIAVPYNYYDCLDELSGSDIKERFGRLLKWAFKGGYVDLEELKQIINKNLFINDRIENPLSKEDLAGIKDSLAGDSVQTREDLLGAMDSLDPEKIARAHWYRFLDKIHNRVETQIRRKQSYYTDSKKKEYLSALKVEPNLNVVFNEANLFIRKGRSEKS